MVKDPDITAPQIEREIIAQGKTKFILQDGPLSKHTVIIKNKDAITAQDGLRKNEIGGKAELATTTTANCFQLLDHAGIENHFLQQIDETSFRAVKLEMIPIEVVVRRIATGSYLKRNPAIEEGTIFENLIVEFFLKDDANHDPLAIYDFQEGVLRTYIPSKPTSEETRIGTFALNQEFKSTLDTMHELAIQTFTVLEKAWLERRVTLVDLKIECGKDSGGDVIVGDEINNDCWRIWPEGDKAKMKDKQRYRNASDEELKDPKLLGSIKDDYAWVAKQTSFFPAHGEKEYTAPANKDLL